MRRRFKGPKGAYESHLVTVLLAWYIVLIPFCLIAAAVSTLYIGAAAALNYFLYVWLLLSPLAGTIDYFEKGEQI